MVYIATHKHGAELFVTQGENLLLQTFLSHQDAKDIIEASEETESPTDAPLYNNVKDAKWYMLPDLSVSHNHSAVKAPKKAPAKKKK
jgi:hypothetical protein